MAWMRSGVRSPSAPQIVSIVLLAACNASSPVQNAPHERVDAGVEPRSAAPVVVEAGASHACTSDADCRTWSSYCKDAPCVCRVLTKDQPDPQCAGAGERVMCFADPCMRKAAACQDGRCALVVAPQK